MSAETHLVIYLPVKLISSTKSERLSLHSSFSIKIASLGCIRLKSRLRRSVTYQSKINNINLFNLYIIRISFREFSILQQLRTIKISSILKLSGKDGRELYRSKEKL